MILQQHILVPPSARGRRLDAYLADVATRSAEGPCAGLSRARFAQLIDASAVTVDDKPCRSALRLKGGERVAVAVPAPVPMAIAPVPMPLDVLYEDADIIVLNKAAGVVVHPGAGTRGPTLVHGLLAHCGDLSGIGGVMRPGIVHRLDRGTTGVMVVAKHDRAHEHVARQFAQREVTKRYTALVLGTPTPPVATLKTFYGRHPTHRLRFTGKVTSGKTAITTYRTLGTAHGVSLLDVLLGTGRTHQIRVHLSEAGHAIVGDALYGGRNVARIGHVPWRVLCGEWEHQALHATRLELVHPTTSTPLVFVAPLPASWAQLAAGVMTGVAP